jgi:hypothetical protein
MSHRTEIAKASAAGLRAFAAKLARNPVVIGFDGFVDSIIEVVDTRESAEKYEPVRTIGRFGEKIVAAAGQSSNYELIVKLEKLGGNGPIMANAMASIGFPTTYIGSLGYPSIHHVFEPMTKIATCMSFCEPGYTDALEFDDGKLMFGKHGTLKDITAEQMKKVVGDATLIEVLSRSQLLGMVNWTMLTKMDGIWQYLMREIFPKLTPGSSGRRIIFIDLADPEKRTRADLLGALWRCTEFQKHADVVVGYNLKEAVQVAEVLGVKVGAKPEAEIEPMARGILEKLGVKTVVIHPRGGAAAASAPASGAIESATFAGPFVARPKLSTGAGDNFNAGFCLGLLAGLTIEQALCVGTATSGYYVRNAGSPTIAQLAEFCDNLPAPEPTAA